METRNWYAWINLMPPQPDDFHVIGEVFVDNPGMLPVLYFKVPQGINPSILLLDMSLIQQPGFWPQVRTWVQCRFDLVLSPESTRYTDVEVFFEDGTTVQMVVDEVS